LVVPRSLKTRFLPRRSGFFVVPGNPIAANHTFQAA